MTGSSSGDCTFLTIKSPGSGYAGQVWQCQILDETPSGFLGAGRQIVALKVLRPRSEWKTFIRDILFGLCFQTTFAPRLREEALRAGLIWQELLYRAAEIEFGPGSIARPLGYFWDASLASYVEVCEWVQGRPSRLEPDEHLLDRHPPPEGLTSHIPETTRLKSFMDRLADLCRRMGAVGLSRQYAWYTFVSQANVLVRAGPPSQFTAVDCRPGLAFPFFLPFSPSHLGIALGGLPRGTLAHYAEIDLQRLDNFVREHPGLGADTPDLVKQLQANETAWRLAIPDLWNHLTRFFRNSAMRTTIRKRLCEDWLRLGWIDAAKDESIVFGLYVLASVWPFLLRLLAHKRYRLHLKQILFNPSYRHIAISDWAARDLPQWVDTGRVPLGYAPKNYIIEKMLLSLLLPGWHRIIIDPLARYRFTSRFLLQPYRLLTRQTARENWLEAILSEEFERGAASPQKARDLMVQVREPHLQGFIRDLGISFGLDFFSRLLYMSLAWYGLRSGNFYPFGLAFLSPISPSGLLRFVYILGQMAAEMPDLLLHPPVGHSRTRLILARAGALLISPIRWVGNLFPLVEISAVYPRLAFLLAAHFISSATALVPVFGGRGKLLEIWVFQLVFNAPLSLWYHHRRVPSPMQSSAPSPAELQTILASVPLFQSAGEINIVPLQGVISLNNYNYRFGVGGNDYLLRAAAETSHYLGIRREEEIACTAAAAQAGIAPELIHTDPQGHIISRFVEGRHWEKDDFHNPTAIARLGDILSRLHAIQGVPAEGSVRHRIKRLMDSARSLGLEIPPSAQRHLARLNALPHSDRFHGLSHNDFWPNNFLDDGKRLYLVDWEFSGDGDGLYDLASISMGAGYNEQEQRMLLSAYGCSDEGVYQELQEMQNVVLFFETAWALVMHGLRGSNDYDYLSHTQRLLQIIDERQKSIQIQ